MTATTLESKKTALLKKQKVLSIGIIAPITSEELLNALVAACEFDMPISVLASGSEKAQSLCSELSNNFKKFKIFEDLEQNKIKILEESDVIIFSEIPLIEELQLLQRYNTIPIAPVGGHIEDFNAQKEEGNGFLYIPGSIWQVVRALVRANENYQFSYDWRNLKKSFVEAEF